MSKRLSKSRRLKKKTNKQRERKMTYSQINHVKAWGFKKENGKN